MDAATFKAGLAAFLEATTKTRIKPSVFPTMHANWWATVDEEMFRALVQSNMSTIISIDAYEVIQKRCEELGIEWGE